MVWYSMVRRGVVEYSVVCYGTIRRGILWNVV